MAHAPRTTSNRPAKPRRNGSSWRSRYKIETFRLIDELPTGGIYHICRSHLMRGDPPFRPHNHDFPEVLWIERGQGKHYINDQIKPLRPGDLLLIRPSDVHAFRPCDAEGFVIVNLAFPEDSRRFLRDRYFPNGTWPWSDEYPMPTQAMLSEKQLKRLADMADRLASPRQTLHQLEGCLLDIINLVTLRTPRRLQGAPPEWLQRALLEFSEPKHMPGGVRELARLAGRTPEHLNRVVKEYLGMRAAAIVNERRMDYVGQQLRMSDRPIRQVAEECGLSHTAYFNQLFRQRFATTPAKFRQKHRQGMY